MVPTNARSSQTDFSFVRSFTLILTALILIAPFAAAQSGAGEKSETLLSVDLGSASVQEFIDRQNELSRALGQPYAIERVEVLASAAAASRAGTAPQTTFYAKTHSMRLSSRWVQGDPRRQGRRAVVYGNWDPGMYTLDLDHQYFNVETGVDAAAATWNGVSCSNARLVKTPLPPLSNPSRYLRFRGYTNVPHLVDVGIVGWLPGWLFEQVFGPFGREMLGVTIYNAFVDPVTGRFTDIDGDRRPDQANAEIWFQEGGFYDLRWTLQPNADFNQFGFDVETIALHELGHALDLGHMGVIFTDAQGALHESPLAVMNPLATLSKRVPYGTDAAALCSNYAAWTLP